MWNQIPIPVVHRILEYDGRIRYHQGCYVDRIHANDSRYDILVPILRKRLAVLNTIERGDDGTPDFYFEVEFDGAMECVGMAFYYSADPDDFEISYFDFRNLENLLLIKTIYY
jgi:hypothetical protein